MLSFCFVSRSEYSNSRSTFVCETLAVPFRASPHPMEVSRTHTLTNAMPGRPAHPHGYTHAPATANSTHPHRQSMACTVSGKGHAHSHPTQGLERPAHAQPVLPCKRTASAVMLSWLPQSGVCSQREMRPRGVGAAGEAGGGLRGIDERVSAGCLRRPGRRQCPPRRGWGRGCRRC